MNRFPAYALVIFALCAPALVNAQAAPASQTAAAQAQTGLQYNDPAMSFTAPSGFKALAVPKHDPANFENPTVMAAFSKNPGTHDAMNIVLRMENFDGDADAFATTADNDLRGQTDGAFISRKTTALPNGMPAIWEDVTIGSGFDQLKTYQYLWSDGVRGVTLSLVCRDGVIDDAQAKALLSNVSAVAYPKYRY